MHIQYVRLSVLTPGRKWLPGSRLLRRPLCNVVGAGARQDQLKNVPQFSPRAELAVPWSLHGVGACWATMATNLTEATSEDSSSDRPKLQASTGSLQQRREAVRNRREAAERARRQAEQQAAAERDVWAQQAACLRLQRAVRRRLALALVQQRRSEVAAVQLSQGVRQQEAAQATLTPAPHPRPSP